MISDGRATSLLEVEEDQDGAIVRCCLFLPHFACCFLMRQEESEHGCRGPPPKSRSFEQRYQNLLFPTPPTTNHHH